MRDEIRRLRHDLELETQHGLEERLALIAEQLAGAAAASVALRERQATVRAAGQARPGGPGARAAGAQALRDLAAGPSQLLAVRGWLRPGHFGRRNRRTGEMAFYRCYSPRHIPLPALARIAGIRWSTEANFQASKGLAGLDEHQVRRWGSWYRWTTLAMLALAFLTITAATVHSIPQTAGHIPLTRLEVAALFAALVIGPARDARHRLRWSAWRRRSQHRARTCHYQRQASQP